MKKNHEHIFTELIPHFYKKVKCVSYDHDLRARIPEIRCPLLDIDIQYFFHDTARQN